MARNSYLLALLLLVACDTGGPNDAGMSPDGPLEADVDVGTPLPTSRLELGTGTTRFETIDPDSTMELPLVLGPQGGWHIFASVRLHGIDVNRCYLIYELKDDTGEVRNYPAEIILSERRVVREGDHWLRSGDLVILDITMPSDLVGQELTIEATARPMAGGEYSDSRRIRIGDEVDGTGGPGPGS
jgi:hypothetical protein